MTWERTARGWLLPAAGVVGSLNLATAASAQITTETWPVRSRATRGSGFPERRSD
jgi:hypothetical protein